MDLKLTILSRHTHENGIRKVPGASPAGIFWPLTKEFTYTVAAAAEITSPTAYLSAASGWSTFPAAVRLLS